MRESRTYGSVRAKAEWLSYSTIIKQHAFFLSSHNSRNQKRSSRIAILIQAGRIDRRNRNGCLKFVGARSSLCTRSQGLRDPWPESEA